MSNLEENQIVEYEYENTMEKDYSNLGTLCRTCGRTSDYLIPIFSEDGLRNNLAELINKHLPITVSPNDEMPHVLCNKCVNTITEWDELKQLCLYADATLRQHIGTNEVPETNQIEENEIFIIETFNENVKSSRPQFYSCNAEFNGDSADAGGDRDTASDEEDEPLSALASKKSSNLYDTFYRALVNFRDHFASEHRTKSLRSGLTDSEDSELSADSNESMSEISPSEPRDVDKYDDLTEQNRRKNHLDEQTRDELNQARRKIDGKVFYTCSICEKNLSSRHTYLFHQRIHTGERPCVCHLCGKQFRAPPGLRRHLAHTHERRRPRACPLCARAFASQQNLRQHLRTHTGERPYVCPLCNKRFTQGGSLHVHLRSHGSAAPHRCVDCGKRFKLRANLARHRLHHTGERPHACPHCARRFAHRHELAAHRAAHLSVAPHACTRCGAAFKQRRALRDHARRHHPAAL